MRASVAREMDDVIMAWMGSAAQRRIPCGRGSFSTRRVGSSASFCMLLATAARADHAVFAAPAPQDLQSDDRMV
jgi:hypothetical protein